MMQALIDALFAAGMTLVMIHVIGGLVVYGPVSLAFTLPAFVGFTVFFLSIIDE